MEYIILGAARSGLAAYRLLEAEGNSVYLYDDFQSVPGKNFLKKDALKKRLKEPKANYSLVLSPGIAPDHWAVLLAQKKNLPMHSELDIALKHYLGKIIAVTGTNGKSTVCAMLAHIAGKVGIEASICGNFGIPLCDLILEKKAKSTLILELSSFQIEQSAKIYPSVAIFTSFAPDHLERHKSLKNYFLAKWKLFEGLNNTPFIFSESAYQAYQEFIGEKLNEKNIHVLNKKLISTLTKDQKNLSKSLKLNGSMSALAMSELFAIEPERSFASLASYQELPHRVEKVGEYLGHEFIDDSKATNVEASLHALSQMESPVYLLLGGQGKGESFAPILSYKNKIAAVFAFGSTKEQIEQELGASLEVHCQETLDQAIETLWPIFTKEPRTVLLSPACASLDQFKSYAARGEHFTSLITPLLKKLLK